MLIPNQNLLYFKILEDLGIENRPSLGMSETIVYLTDMKETRRRRRGRRRARRRTGKRTDGDGRREPPLLL